MTAREQILASIEANPGINKSQLGRDLDLTWSTLCYHIRVLQNHGRIQSQHLGRESILFPCGIPREQRRLLSVLRDDDALNVIAALLENPGARVSDLDRRIPHSQKVIRRHLRTLEAHGIVDQEGPRPAAYRVREDVAAYVRSRLRGRSAHSAILLAAKWLFQCTGRWGSRTLALRKETGSTSRYAPGTPASNGTWDAHPAWQRATTRHHRMNGSGEPSQGQGTVSWTIRQPSARI